MICNGDMTAHAWALAQSGSIVCQLRSWDSDVLKIHHALPPAGPLFKFLDGRSLTRQRLVTAVKEALDVAGVESGQYSGHSFRIGAATTAAARGLEVSTV